MDTCFCPTPLYAITHPCWDWNQNRVSKTGPRKMTSKTMHCHPYVKLCCAMFPCALLIHTPSLDAFFYEIRIPAFLSVLVSQTNLRQMRDSCYYRIWLALGFIILFNDLRRRGVVCLDHFPLQIRYVSFGNTIRDIKLHVNSPLWY